MVAMGLALAYPIAVVAGPWALAGVTVAAGGAGCALALARRPSAPLRAALVAIALWLAAGLGGALVLRGHALRGAAWVLLALYAVPLPLIPWLYARTFDHPENRVRGKRVEGRGNSEVTRHPSRRMSSVFLLPSSLSLFRHRHDAPRALTKTAPEDPGNAR